MLQSICLKTLFVAACNKEIISENNKLLSNDILITIMILKNKANRLKKLDNLDKNNILFSACKRLFYSTSLIVYWNFIQQKLCPWSWFMCRVIENTSYLSFLTVLSRFSRGISCQVIIQYPVSNKAKVKFCTQYIPRKMVKLLTKKVRYYKVCAICFMLSLYC